MCGSIWMLSVSNDKYFVTLYDDSLATSVLRFIETKDQTVWAVNIMVIKLESVAANRAQARRIRMDNVGKYIEKKRWFNDSGIMPEYTPSYVRESNG